MTNIPIRQTVPPFLKRNFLYVVYGFCAVIILGPLLLPGFVLTLDMVFVPHAPMPEEVSSSYLFQVVLHTLGYIIPGDVLQKLILFGILLASGVGAHNLVQGLKPHKVEGKDTPSSLGLRLWTTTLAPYVAGMLYLFNPFVYGRFMAGQYAVLLGYALLPFFLRALLLFFHDPTLKQTIPVVVYALAISIVSIHTFGFLLLLIPIALGVALWRQHTKQYALRVLKYGIIASLAVVALSSYWLIPTLLGQGDIARSTAVFDEAHRQAFATDGGLFNVLQLQGFWAEAQGHFMLRADPLPLTGLWQVLLWIVVATGIVAAWRKQRDMAVMFGIIGMFAILFALSTPVNAWLSHYIALFAGYREPHKFVALLALSFAYFGAWGAAHILQTIVQHKQRGVYIAAALGMLILPMLNTPTMLWGFYDQLKPTHYPTDWHTMDKQLGEGDGKVLFLPWHLYMYFNFADRIIANPADKFFQADVITSKDPEFANISQPFDPTITRLNKEVLPRAVTSTDLGAQLKPFDIRYVLLAKENDYKEYGYLERQRDLQLVRDTPTLQLYRNTALEEGK